MSPVPGAVSGIGRSRRTPTGAPSHAETFPVGHTWAPNGLRATNPSSATERQLAGPSSVLVARDGSLYISEFSRGRIRRLSANGMLTTVIG